MANFINRARYYLSSLRKLPFPRYYRCPNCGGRAEKVVDRKYFITSLARCEECRILFRRPITTVEENTKYYRKQYTTKLTDAPIHATKEQLNSLDFLRAVKDVRAYIDVLLGLTLGERPKLLDYGCSWGYCSVQIAAAGFAVTGYEISNGNRRFARDRMGVDVIDDFDAYANAEENHGRFDAFFSSHVLEHMPSVEHVLNQAMKLIRPGGYLIIIVPNGSNDFMRHNYRRWRRLWGEVHPLFLTDEFFYRRFKGLPILLSSIPVPEDALSAFVNGRDATPSLTGKELVCIVRKT